MKNYNPKDLNTSLVNEPFVSYYSRNPQKEFDRIQKLAEETKGIVMPYLNDSYVEILQVEPHDFITDKPLVEAQKWAEKNIVGIYTAHKNTIDEFEYQISSKAIKKYIQSSNKSHSIYSHLSVLKVLPQIIEESIAVETHADYKKVNEERSINNPIDKTVLIHRFYGVVFISEKIYRVKTTIKEYKDYSILNKAYSFEVIKIELLDNKSNSPISGSQCTNFIYNKGFSIDVANILQNVEKSYDKGKFLLEETKKHAEIVAEFEVEAALSRLLVILTHKEG
jgi:hypothetical protein